MTEIQIFKIQSILGWLPPLIYKLVSLLQSPVLITHASSKRENFNVQVWITS